MNSVALSAFDEDMMREALCEAAKGVGHTSPNPAVGAVIVLGQQIVGRGWHRGAGLPHAEVEALRSVPEGVSSQGACIYVTLEPCSTHGRTPPCTEALISAGIRRVVIGTLDPNPLHAGRALTLLKEAGMEVQTGVLEQQCSDLNRAFNKWIVSGMPWVIAKAGMTLDGRLTRPPREGQWITNEEARQDAMVLRSSVDAIVIGANTLRNDNPRLNIRGLSEFGYKQPLRVVLAGELSVLPNDAHVFTDEQRDRTRVFRCESLSAVLKSLGRDNQVSSVLIEGGMQVLGQAFEQRLVDEVVVYMAPLLCGGPVVAIGGVGAANTAASHLLSQVRYTRLGDNLRLHARAVSAPLSHKNEPH